MKRHLAMNFIKVLINIILFVIGIFLISLVIGSIYAAFVDKNDFLSVKTFINFVVGIIYFLIIYNLRKIVYSINLTPFCSDNVKRFKIIGYCIFSLSIVDAIVNFKAHSGFEICSTKYGSLKGSFFLFLVLACMAFVLAEVFQKAIEIKEENDLTV